MNVQQQQAISPALPSFLFMLGDDIGWSDFSYNGGIAYTPNIDQWVTSSGSIKLQDFHSGGTVCSPTRATVLTGRNHFRDCVDFVYACSDMSQCVPKFEFAPSHTFTIGDAVRTGRPNEYDDENHNGIYFAGKWHLGSFFNDSEAYGGISSSPLIHGFTKMNATIEVVPTATANCQCKVEWLETCDFGHYNKPNHCFPSGQCCFNYWWDDPLAPHGVTNLTWPTPADDSLYLADAFTRFLHDRSQQQKPFLAQISFHNCHIPFIGSKISKTKCKQGLTCKKPKEGEASYTEEELDYYACLTELDNAVGIILQALKDYGYYENTMTWFTTDNGPEENCPPKGICKYVNGNPQRPKEGPGSAGILRGRKRDIYEGGHRVPGIISFPSEIKGTTNHTSWETVTTMDFLPTIMELLNVDRPPEQQSWAMDGRSVLPLLRDPVHFRWRNTEEGPRAIGIGFHHPKLNRTYGWGFRYGRWKYVEGSASCQDPDCRKPQLYDLKKDLGERNDVSNQYPHVLAGLKIRFREWHSSVIKSRSYESKCKKARKRLPLPESFSTTPDILV